MKKVALLLLFAFLLTSVVFAQIPGKPKIGTPEKKTEKTEEKKEEKKVEKTEEAKPILFKDDKEGISLMVPAGFKQHMNTPTMKGWIGPKKGPVIWSMNLSITDVPDGVSMGTMYKINYGSDKKKKRTYSSVEKIKVNGSIGAYIMKEVKKPDSEIYRWIIKAWGNNRMYQLMFAGSCSTFKEFKPIISNTIKSAKIKKAKSGVQDK
ncbi:MAG: hypothetical protein K8T10_19910 [Candidatus Eremiobacteraeota bacterium]|nr:hypothetical protein [Candidatus Eremiobacteraeota bacterium]